MKFLEKYKWEMNPDGTYTIFGVPIFAHYDSTEKRGGVGEVESKRIIANFQKDEDVGFYPRVFIGHHNFASKEKAMDNRTGAGFIDNLTERDGVFFCDISLIPNDVFQDIKEKRYPYRSSEYLVNSNKITGLALLESQEPFHKTPPLILEDESTLTFCQDGEVVLFQKGNDMPEEEKKAEERIQEDVISEKKENFSDGEAVPTEDAEEKEVGEEKEEAEPFEATEEPKADKMDSVIKMLEILVNALVEKNSDAKVEPAVEDKNIETPPASSIAYQELEKKIANLESNARKDILTFQLREVCKDKGLGVDEQIEVFSNFSNDKAREDYLGTLKNLKIENTVPAHFMSSMAQEGMRLFQTSQGAEKEAVQTFVGGQDEANAKRAVRLYQETMKSGDGERIKMFNSLASDIKGFVNLSVLAAKTDENYFNNLTVKV